MNRHPALTTRARALRLRRAAVGVGTVGLLAVVTAGLTGPAASEAAKPPKRAPDVSVTAIGPVPATTAPGATFKVAATIRNRGTTRAKASTVRFLFSRDTVADPADTVLGVVRTSALAPGKPATATATVRVPAAPSAGHVISCAATRGDARPGNNCRASGPVTVVAPTNTPTGPGNPPAPVSTAISGTLTGDLHFTDTYQRTDPGDSQTWTRTADVSVVMAVHGPDTVDTTFESTTSTYALAGTGRQESVAGDCRHVVDDRWEGGGRLAWANDPNNDDIAADFAKLNMSELSMVLDLSWSRTTTRNACGRVETTSGPGRTILDLDLKEVSRTANSVRYAVSAWRGAYNEPSDWDTATGQLILSLN